MANLQIVPACKNVEPQHVQMKVPLYSYGCGRKIRKALAHLRGIYSVTVDYELQKVTVWGICNKYDVLATIRSKRKEARFWDTDKYDKYHKYHKYDKYDDDDDDQSATSSNSPPPAAAQSHDDAAATIRAIHNKLFFLSLHWTTWKKKVPSFLKSYRRNH